MIIKNINDLSTKTKCGQLLAVGFEGTIINDDIKTLIKDCQIGNVILFERNFESASQLFALTKDLQEFAISEIGLPLIISINEEGGMVTQLLGDVTPFPGSMAVSAAITTEEQKNDAYKLGEYMGVELHNLGVNLNFSPCCDVSNNSNNATLNTRSYSDDPKRVAELSALYTKGLQSQNVIAAAKHFPGLGDPDLDPQTGLDIISHDKPRLDALELVPYVAQIEAGVQAILVAHAPLTAYEPKNIPSTLSYEVLTNLLRNRLGFKGLIVADCLEMDAILKHYGVGQATPLTIAAGADLVLVSNTFPYQQNAAKYLLEAVESGEIALEMLDEKVERILHAKVQIAQDEMWTKDFSKVCKEIGSQKHLDFSQSLTARSLTSVLDDDFLTGKKSAVCIVFEPKDAKNCEDCLSVKVNLSDEIRTHLCLEVFTIGINPKKTESDYALQIAKRYEQVIVFTYNSKKHKNQGLLVNAMLENKIDLMVCAMHSPYDAEEFPRLKNYVTTYELTKNSVSSLMFYLQEITSAQGKLPVKIQNIS